MDAFISSCLYYYDDLLSVKESLTMSAPPKLSRTCARVRCDHITRGLETTHWLKLQIHYYIIRFFYSLLSVLTALNLLTSLTYLTVMDPEVHLMSLQM